MLLEADGDGVPNGIPDSVQALIARAHRPAAAAREAAAAARRGDRPRLLARRARAARAGARHATALLERAAATATSSATVERSAIPGDRAYQFSHVLIRDVAYAGHDEGRAGREPPALRGLDRGARSRTTWSRSAPITSTARQRSSPSSTAAVPAELAARRGRCARAGRRARAVVATRSPMPGGSSAARSSSSRRSSAATSPPTRPRGLNEFATVAHRDGAGTRRGARDAGDAALEGRALTALAEVAMSRDGDPAAATRLAERRARRSCPSTRSMPGPTRCGGSPRLRGGRVTCARPRPTRARRSRSPRRAGRRDLWVRGMTTLQWLLELRLELDAAEAALAATLEHPAEGVLEQARARHATRVAAAHPGPARSRRAPSSTARRQLYLDAGAAGDAAWSGLHPRLDRRRRRRRSSGRASLPRGRPRLRGERGSRPPLRGPARARRGAARSRADRGSRAARAGRARPRQPARPDVARPRRRRRSAGCARPRAATPKPRSCCASRSRCSRAPTSACSRSRPASRSTRLPAGHRPRRRGGRARSRLARADPRLARLRGRAQRRAGLDRLAKRVDQQRDRGRCGDRDDDGVDDQRDPQRTLALRARRAGAPADSPETARASAETMYWLRLTPSASDRAASSACSVFGMRSSSRPLCEGSGSCARLGVRAHPPPSVAVRSARTKTSSRPSAPAHLHERPLEQARDVRL